MRGRRGDAPRSSTWLEERGPRRGARSAYRLRDWLISRQRYWGAPIPIVDCAACGLVPVPDDAAAGAAAGGRGLRAEGRARRWPRPRSGVNAPCPSCGGAARRETDTMDTFVDSSWYFLRYVDARTTTAPCDRGDRRLLAARRPVHRRRRARDPAPAVRALLHEGAARRSGWSGSTEPFANLFTQGMIYRGGAKMSKSKGNVVAPDDVVEQYGADALRLYSCSWARPTRTRSGPTPAWRARFVPHRLWRGLRDRGARPPATRCAASTTPRRPRRCARAQRTGRSRRSPTTSAGACTSTPRSRPAWSS